MSLYLGNQLLAGVATNTIYNAHDLLDFKWTDHLLNDQSWLRADTFSWQDGTVYTSAYNHLVADVTNGTSQTETIGSYTITYWLATDGHKICTPDQETTVSNIYNESGVAWYYILDTANQRFKLPRTKYGFVGVRDSVGKYVEAGLPNITGDSNSIYSENTYSSTGAFGTSSSTKKVYAYTSNATTYCEDFDASRSNTIYGNSNTVQPPATQMYLYFYVGQFSQSATEQTAGLNSELFNGKVDLDATNLSTAGKSLISGLGMPSNRYIDLTRGASGSNYTAPANGWFTACVTGSQSHYCFIRSHDSRIGSSYQFNAGSGSWHCVTIPCKSGDVVTMQYGNCDFQRFAFVYAEGEENV